MTESADIKIAVSDIAHWVADIEIEASWLESFGYATGNGEDAIETTITNYVQFHARANLSRAVAHMRDAVKSCRLARRAIADGFPLDDGPLIDKPQTCQKAEIELAAKTRAFMYAHNGKAQGFE